MKLHISFHPGAETAPIIRYFPKMGKWIFHKLAGNTFFVRWLSPLRGMPGGGKYGPGFLPNLSWNCPAKGGWDLSDVCCGNLRIGGASLLNNVLPGNRKPGSKGRRDFPETGNQTDFPLCGFLPIPAVKSLFSYWNNWKQHQTDSDMAQLMQHNAAF